MKLGHLMLSIFVMLTLGCAHTDRATLQSTSSCPECPQTHENLDATLYLQTAAEYDALALGTYATAEFLAARGLSDATWTALDDVSVLGKPPAVIVDVDETVLDNAPYQARLILDDEQYGSESWKLWVEEAQAEPVPGAVEFARWATDQGITIFYVTNRRADEEAATRKNLEAVGFPIRSDIDTVLTRGELEEWGRDKSTRRAHVANQFRVLLLIGDDLGDFVGRDWGGVEGREAVVRASRDKWGTKWLVLPNPTYGSWMSAILDDAGENTERMKALFDALDPRR